MATPERLFEVPRLEVVFDVSDPSVLKLAFAGAVELDRTNQAQVDLYNALRPGEQVEVIVTCDVRGTRKLHHRDSEGDLDDIVETKALAVTDVYPARAES